MLNNKKRIIFWVCYWLLSFFTGLFWPFSSTPREGPRTTQTVTTSSLEILAETGDELVSNDYLIKNYDLSFDSCTVENKDTVYESPDPSSILTIVDKNHKLPDNFNPGDIVLLQKSDYPVINNLYLRSGILTDLANMLNAMSASGIKVYLKSGWRSISTQQKIYDLWRGRIGDNQANNYAALPGFSEHHLGTAVDFTTNTANFQGSKADKWLQDNAYKYGFIMSYPPEKSEITGYAYEPWHYRYVGIESSTIIHHDQITLSEFLYLQNKICIREE